MSPFEASFYYENSHMVMEYCPSFDGHYSLSNNILSFESLLKSGSASPYECNVNVMDTIFLAEPYQ